MKIDEYLVTCIVCLFTRVRVCILDTQYLCIGGKMRKNEGKKRIYVTSTPYHLILAIANEQNYENKASLIIIQDFEIQRILFNKLKSIFKKIFIFNGNYKKRNYFEKFIDLINNSNKIVKICTEFNYIYFHSDDRLEIQILINKYKKIKKFVCIEDGMAAYNDYLLKMGIKGLLIRKLISFGKYKNISVLGTYIDNINFIAICPKLLRPELNKHKIVEINRNNFISSINLLYVDLYPNINIKENSLLIFLDNSEGIDNISYYIKIITKITNECLNINKNIYLKYHPREQNRYLNLVKNDLIVEFNNVIPSEYIMLRSMNKNITVISMASTALITANYLNCFKILSINKIVKNTKISGCLYNKINVKQCSSIEQILSFL